MQNRFYVKHEIINVINISKVVTIHYFEDKVVKIPSVLKDLISQIMSEGKSAFVLPMRIRIGLRRRRVRQSDRSSLSG